MKKFELQETDDLDHLSPEHRSIIQLHYVSKLSYSQIEGMFRIKRGTIRSRLNRARTKLLKRRLEVEVVKPLSSTG